MKPLYALLLIQIFFLTKINAQFINPCLNFCSYDLRVPLSDVASQIAQDELTYCKKVNNNCVTINKFDVLYSQNNCVPGQHINDCITDLSILKIHVYYPTNINYLTCSLPAIILFHGGAFNECGDYNDKGIREFGKKLAARGFVVFN